jgi:hypothetical protein
MVKASHRLQQALARIEAAKQLRMAATMGMGMGTLINEYEKQLEEKHNYVEPKSVVPPPTNGALVPKITGDAEWGTELPSGKDDGGNREIQPISARAESEYIPANEWDESEFLNGLQLQASNGIISGESLCLIGKAGTGKTTAIRETIKRLLQRGSVPLLRSTDEHKYLKRGFAGIVCCAFTNRATNNIAKGFDLGETPIHFITVHKLLEYYKEEYVKEDAKTGLMSKSWRFVPRRNRYNPLPSGIKLIILEESSQINKDDLHAKLLDACTGRDIQFVYLGDIQQLPPIGGDGILGYKINELPCTELTQIYRQAAENPIIRLAWEIASGGKNLTKSYLIDNYSPRKDLTAPIQINFWEKVIDWEHANIAMSSWITTQIDKDIFNWERNDIILMPYNKKFGTIELNRAIAQHLSQKGEVIRYEIIAGFQKHYYAVGDKVLYNKKEGVVTRIGRNGRYIGRTPLPPSVELGTDGTYKVKDKGVAKIADLDEHGMTEEELNQYLDNISKSDQSEEVMNQASHIMNVRLLYETMPDGADQVELSTRGEYGECEFGYAISIHKSQGSEWRKVFLILHNSHHQLNREMLYTAVTRASQQLFIIAEPDSFTKAVSRQRIPGDTLEEKKKWFLQKMMEENQDE